MDTPTALLISFILFITYLIHVNIALSAVPAEAKALSPHRFTAEAIRKTYDKLRKDPIKLDLPPRTGRRYIVVGGAGFLPGTPMYTKVWIITGI